jgi:RND family efflux transporter MFP subunit
MQPIPLTPNPSPPKRGRGEGIPTVLRRPTVLLALLLAAGCNQPAGPSPSGGQAQGSAAVPEVKVVKPVRKSLSHAIAQPGEIQAYYQTPIYARIPGYVDKVHKDIDDRVEEGEVLAELSVPEMDEELNQKEALVGQARAEIEQATKLLASAEADIESAAAKVKEAEASRERVNAERRRAESQYERLRKSSAVLTPENIEEALLGFEAAKAAVAEVEAKVGSARADRVSKEARRDKARADLSAARAHLRVAEADQRRYAELVKYAKLRAPFAGVVTRRKVDPGYSVQPAAAGTPGEALFVVARTDTMRIFVDVPENDAVLVTKGTPAVVSVQALGGEEFSAEVTRTSFALDTTKERVLRAEIDLSNPAGRLRPGMYAYATIKVGRANALTVPASAVVTQGDQTFCYRVEGGKAVRTPVRLGFRDGQLVELLKRRGPGQEADWEDFTGEEEIVTSNPSALSDGQAVSVASGS